MEKNRIPLVHVTNFPESCNLLKPTKGIPKPGDYGMEKNRIPLVHVTNFPELLQPAESYKRKFRNQETPGWKRDDEYLRSSYALHHPALTGFSRRRSYTTISIAFDFNSILQSKITAVKDRECHYVIITIY
jgi:hypothetical protein